MPSNHLILCCLLLLLPSIFPSIRWPKYWSFSFNISPSNEHPGMISFRMDGWISLQSKGLSRVKDVNCEVRNSVDKESKNAFELKLLSASNRLLHFTSVLWYPLQGSCLESPRDGGAWWAAIYGVAQSQTRLKRLSSSSMISTKQNL